MVFFSVHETLYYMYCTGILAMFNNMHGNTCKFDKFVYFFKKEIIKEFL